MVGPRGQIVRRNVRRGHARRVLVMASGLGGRGRHNGTGLESLIVLRCQNNDSGEREGESYRNRDSSGA